MKAMRFFENLIKSLNLNSLHTRLQSLIDVCRVACGIPWSRNCYLFLKPFCFFYTPSISTILKSTNFQYVKLIGKWSERIWYRMALAFWLLSGIENLHYFLPVVSKTVKFVTYAFSMLMCFSKWPLLAKGTNWPQ